MATSHDEGMTWEQEESLLQSPSKSPAADRWPSCIVLGDGEWGICYMDRDEEGRGSIRGLLFRPDPFPEPRGLSISASTKPSTSLRWNPVRGAAYYIVCRDTHRSFIPVWDRGSDGNAIGMTVESHLVDSDVQPGMTYYYSVIPVRGRGKLLPGAGGIGPASRTIGIAAPVKKE